MSEVTTVTMTVSDSSAGLVHTVVGVVLVVVVDVVLVVVVVVVTVGCGCGRGNYSSKIQDTENG